MTASLKVLSITRIAKSIFKETKWPHNTLDIALHRPRAQLPSACELCSGLLEPGREVEIAGG